MDPRGKWDQRHAQAADVDEPVWVLQAFAHLLPEGGGAALDLACGLGANALFLARRGFEVHAWDISPVALARLRERAAEEQLAVQTRQRDCEQHPPAPESLDVLVVSHFLYRPILPALAASLRPGGLLYYETHTQERPTHLPGPSNPDFLLCPGELLDAFSALRVHVYREDGLTGDLQKGRRGKASIVARKP